MLFASLPSGAWPVGSAVLALHSGEGTLHGVCTGEQAGCSQPGIPSLGTSWRLCAHDPWGPLSKGFEVSRQKAEQMK